MKFPKQFLSFFLSTYDFISLFITETYNKLIANLEKTQQAQYPRHIPYQITIPLLDSGNLHWNNVLTKSVKSVKIIDGKHKQTGYPISLLFFPSKLSIR